MFQHAYKTSSAFTRPVVMSRLMVSGKCSAGIGAYVVINDEGWFVTAYHIVEQCVSLSHGEKVAKEREAKEESIRNNASLSPKERSRQLKLLGKQKKDDTVRSSAWWGDDALRIKDNKFDLNPIADLAIAQFDNFNPSTVTSYPKLKDPKQEMEPGKSLCKLGFPFNQIVPQFDAKKNAFCFSRPIPRFPIEGMMTRTVTLQDKNDHDKKAMMIETSTPGLRGQSGGPIFDEQGTIWAIQSQTAHYSLGFAKGGMPEQYLNVGIGAHSQEIISLLDQHKVQYELSAY